MTVAETAIEANGLAHHVLTWTPPSAPRGDFVLCHGFLDLAWSWKGVAERLVSHGYRVFAFDWRGHGETEHVGAGGYYHFPDYVLDLDLLLPKLTDAQVHLVGHSMGGTACGMYAGVRPERLRTLTLIEGLGPPESAADDTPDRVLMFLESTARRRRRPPSAVADLDAAVARMRVQNPRLPDDLGHFLAEKGTRRLADGQRVFTFDPLHQTRSPAPFRKDAFMAFLRRITAPTLVVGATDGFRLGDEAERAAAIAEHRVVELGPVSHMIHWLAPVALADALHAHVEAHTPP